MSTRTVMVYRRFERLWHWTQMSCILVLLFTGFAIRGLHRLIDFDTAVTWHTGAALVLLGVWLFAVFWLFTTGEWRHYLPTTQGLGKVIRYYAYGIFQGESHPYHKALLRKHNPLQAMAYGVLKLVLFPAIWVSGIIYLLYGLWQDLALGQGWLGGVAFVHVAAAYAILAFVIIHVYLLTTGHSLREHLMPMVTGWDQVDLTTEEEAYLLKDEPGRIR